MQQLTIQEQIQDLEHRLRNNPHGIPNSKLPKKQQVIDHMKKMLTDEKAMWCKHDEWYFIMLREGQKLPQLPLGENGEMIKINKFEWINPQTKPLR